ncbi:secreted protein [Rhodopirellula baltica WH47]|uniref:Secreted protein n=1 Tax=Rhodopirellula baltica WH47 TaxID=991778 RepID=F2ALL3_RHOBT|nr:secreted protein [Rhodopirellula baltica WH47]
MIRKANVRPSNFKRAKTMFASSSGAFGDEQFNQSICCTKSFDQEIPKSVTA